MYNFIKFFKGTKSDGAASKEAQKQNINRPQRHNSGDKQTPGDEFEKGLLKLLKTVAGMIAEDIPKSGYMKTFHIRFQIPDRFADGWMFTVDPLYKDMSKRVLGIAAVFPDDDRYARPMAGYITSEYIFTGTKREIIDYLTSPECVGEVLKSIDNLDAAVKNHD